MSTLDLPGRHRAQVTHVPDPDPAPDFFPADRVVTARPRRSRRRIRRGVRHAFARPGLLCSNVPTRHVITLVALIMGIWIVVVLA